MKRPAMKKHALCVKPKKSRGIHIYTKFICLECEKKVVSTSTSDPNYEFFVRKLKALHTPTLYS